MKRKNQPKLTASPIAAVSAQNVKDLRDLIDYSYAEESRHWLEEGRSENHIFNAISRLDVWLSGLQKKKLKSKE